MIYSGNEFRDRVPGTYRFRIPIFVLDTNGGVRSRIARTSSPFRIIAERREP